MPDSKMTQRRRIADYIALHQRLDDIHSVLPEGKITFQLSRELDQLSIDIQKHDVHGRKVGQILGWDKRSNQV